MPAPHLNRCPHCNGRAEFTESKPCGSDDNCLQDGATAIRCRDCGAQPFVCWASPDIARPWLAYRWNRRGHVEERA